MPYKIAPTTLSLGFAFWLSACATSQSSTLANSSGAKCNFTVLHTNDHHGHPLRFDNPPQKAVGGLPARLFYVNSIRKSQKNVLVLDAGDINTGRPESNFFDAEPDIVGYNAIGYDAIALGNHEFDKSLMVLQKQIESSKSPFLSANVIQKQNNSTLPHVKPYIIKDFGDCRVAVIGLLASSTQEEISPESLATLRIEDEIAVAQNLVPILKKQADFVIALTHAGIDESDDSGSRKIAKNVAGIDLVVDGHTHTKLEKPLLVKNSVTKKNVPIVQAHEWGLEVGKTEVSLHASGETSVHFENVAIDSSLPEDENLRQKLSPYSEKMEGILSQNVATATAEFEIGKHREMETPIGNLLAESVWTKTKTHKPDLVFVNAGSIRASLRKGPVTQKNIFEMLPYDNAIVLLTLKGAELRTIFATAAALPPGKGAFPSIAGASFTFSRSSKKIISVKIGKKDLDDNKLYRIATHSYLASGGDGYGTFKNGTNVFNTSVSLRDAMVEHAKILETIFPQTDGRIVIKE
jgi:5'-nucleotidase/UDP-sugar diphosphatase